MKETWAFDIGTGISAVHYSMEAFTYESTDYLAKVISDSFSGINMRVDLVSRLFAPNDCSFSLSNLDDSLSASSLEGSRCCITQLLDDVIHRSWTFIIETAVPNNGEIKCTCVDPVARRMEGEFPNTSSIKSNFPSEKVLEVDDARVPITFGTAFIPCAPFLYSGENYHCLGKSGGSYTINKVRPPRSWDTATEWDNSYTYDQANITGEKSSVRGAQLELVDLNGDGTPETYGVWNKNGKACAPLIQFYGDYSTITNPGEFVSNLLQQFGVDSGFLDSDSFDDIDTALSSVVWGGGWWLPESKESLLSQMLINCDCFLSVETLVKMNQFSKTPIETLDRSNIVDTSFSPVRASKASSDGGTVKFAWDGEPQDVLSGETVVGLYGAQSSVTNPSKEAFEYRYGYNNIEAQKFGLLHFQKKFDQKYNVRFETELEKITTGATIVPGQVIRISDDPSGGIALYGEEQDVVISSITFLPGLKLIIEGTVYNHLEEYADLSATEITPDTDLGADFNFMSLANIVTVSGINIFHYAAGASVPAPTSVDLTASLFGELTDYLWQYWVSGSTWNDLSGTNDQATYNLTYNNAAWGTAVSLRVRCKSGDYYGEITITKVVDGTDGADGADGTDGADGADGAQGVSILGGTDWVTGKYYVSNAYVKWCVVYAGTYYLCAVTHTSGTWATDLAAGKWVPFGAQYESLATDILLAQDVTITRCLSFTGNQSYIKILGENGLVVNANSGTAYNAIIINQGNDLQFNTATGNTSRIKWATGSYLLNVGADYAGLYLAFWASSANLCGFRVGYIPPDSASGISAAVRRFYLIDMYASNTAYFEQNNGTNYANLELNVGYFYGRSSIYLSLTSPIISLIASSYIKIDTSYLRGDGYPNIGSTTTAYKFGYGYFVYDLSARALVLTSSITGVTNITMSGALSGASSIGTSGNVTCDSIIFNSGNTYDVGTSAVPARYLCAGSRLILAFASGGGRLDIIGHTTGGSVGAMQGYLTCQRNGTGTVYKIPYYT